MIYIKRFLFVIIAALLLITAEVTYLIAFILFPITAFIIYVAKGSISGIFDSADSVLEFWIDLIRKLKPK